MDLSIFKKYQNIISERKEEKLEIIKLLEEKTGLLFGEKEIMVDKKAKIIKVSVSSSRRMIFVVKQGEKFLKERGYTTTFN